LPGKKMAKKVLAFANPIMVIINQAEQKVQPI
jgi:hypothetical protein